MLRTIFVLLLTLCGVYFAVQSTLHALLFYLWIAYFRPEEFAWGGLIASLDLSWYVGGYLVIRALLRGEAVRPDRRIVLLALLLIQSLLSVCFSSYPTQSWFYWTAFAKALVITYLIASLARGPREFRLVLVTIALSLGVEAAKQGWFGLVLSPGEKNYNPIAFLGDENCVAVGLLMLVPIIAVLAETTERRWEKQLYLFMMLGVLYRAIISYSRGGFLSALALGGVYFLRSQRRARAFVGIALAVMVIIPALPDAFWNRMNTITVDQTEMDTSMRGRLHFWNVALLMAAEHPFSGIGHNAFNTAYDDYDFSKGQYGSARSVHSMWFGALAELGYPGLLLVIANIVIAMRTCAKVRRLARGRPELGMLGRYAAALEGSFVAAVVGGSVLPFQYTEILWHFVGLSMALDAVAHGVSRSTELAPSVAGAEWWSPSPPPRAREEAAA